MKKRSRNHLRKALSRAGIFFNNFGIYIFAITWVITLLLGYFGYYRYYQLNGMEISYSSILYDSLALFTLKGGDLEWSSGYVLALDMARWTALIVYFWAAALIVSRALLGPLRRFRLWLCTDHVIVCGMGRIGSRFAKAMSEDSQVVAIDKGQLVTLDDEARRGSIILVHGNATDEKILRRSGIKRAKYVVTALGDDSANAEIAVQTRLLVKDRSRDPLTCFVHIQDPDLCEVLRVNEYNSDNHSTQLEFYNVVENGARTILNEFPAFQEGGLGNDVQARVMIIGLDAVGKELVLRAAKRWWPRYQTYGKRLQMVLVDTDVNAAIESMCGLHPNLRSVCSFEPIPMDVSKLKAATVEELGWLVPPPSSIYICAPNDSEGLSLAFLLRKRLGNEGAPIVVRMNSDSKPAALLGEEGRNAGWSNIYPFGFWERTCTKALITYGSREVMGQAIHEEYCLEQRTRGTLTEASGKSWDELSEELRQSNRAQADHIITKAKAIDCSIEAVTEWSSSIIALTPYEVHKLSRIEHDRWSNEKIKKGWRYGKVRDDGLRIHDDLIPWTELSDVAKYKDIATVQKIPRILARVDLRLVHKDMALQVAKALLIEKMRYEQKKDGDLNLSSAWMDMADTDRTRYLDVAKAMIASIEGIGCRISGTGSVEEELGAFSPVEVEQANARYNSLMAIDDGKDLAVDASGWPKILSRMDLALFRNEDARKLMEGDREAMLMGFDESELENPFASM